MEEEEEEEEVEVEERFHITCIEHYIQKSLTLKEHVAITVYVLHIN